MNTEHLLKKWGAVLDHESLGKIKNPHKKAAMAVILENQNIHNGEIMHREPTASLTYLLESTNSMGTSANPSTPAAGNVDIYDPVLISLVRRSYPNLIAFDVCGVQPMTGPTGLVFALRSRYGSQTGVEALFNEANTVFGSSSANNAFGQTQVGEDPSLLVANNTAYTFADGMTTAQGENLGQGASSGDFNEMAFSIERVAVTAKTHALKAEYAHELSQDLKAVHGLDAEQELAEILSRELLAEINRRVIRSIYTTATIGAQQNVTNAGCFDLDVDSNGRWMVEKFKGLVYQIEREANAIAKATRAGKGNWIITSSDVASALSMAGVLDSNSALAADNLQVDDTGNTFAGILLGKYNVFVDPYFNSSSGDQFVTVGYRGSSPFDAGLFYCPYIPLTLYRAVSNETLQPKIGFRERSGLVAHPFATDAADGAVDATKKNKYFRLFAVQNLL